MRDHAAPIVTVDLWYHVGSNDEPAGRNGLAHVIEHVMAEQGTAEAKPGELAKIIKGSGGTAGASTNQDWTEYVETVPNAYLETVLWLESDRLAGTLAGMSQSWLDTARASVLNEIALRVDNSGTSGLTATLMEATSATLFPVGHPYHTLENLGTPPSEVNAVTLPEARAFYHTFYVPNNATLVIAGAFDPTAARRMVERYFGPIPRGSAVTRNGRPARLPPR